MNAYEQRVERRRQRLLKAAELSRQRSDAAQKSADFIAYHTSGQPILVGHHSEKRHRKQLDKMWRNLRTASDEHKRAEEYERRAVSVGSAGISSDDPDAPDKIRERIAELEKKRDSLKRVNAQYRKGGWDAVDGISEQTRARLKSNMDAHTWIRQPVESWVFSNLGANIRRLKARLQEIERMAEQPEAAPVERESGIRIEEDKYDNRIRIFFPSKPDERARLLLKRNGFRWSPTAGAWQRQLNTNARYWARYVCEQIEKGAVTA